MNLLVTAGFTIELDLEHGWFRKRILKEWFANPLFLGELVVQLLFESWTVSLIVEQPTGDGHADLRVQRFGEESSKAHLIMNSQPHLC